MLGDMRNEDGTPVVLDDVYITAIGIGNEDEVHGKLAAEYGARGRGPKIGPEYTFGIYMRQACTEPFVIIKTAWGGKSLNFDFRPPSAGEWTPPPGHPDLVKEKVEPLPIPEGLDIPVGYEPSEEQLPKYSRMVGRFLGIRLMRGCAIGEHNGVYPIYIAQNPQPELEGTPFKKGDLIVGVNGEGLEDDPVDHWRREFYAAKSSTWMLKVTRRRGGKLETFDFDISQLLPGGRASVERVNAENAKKRIEAGKNKGYYYRMMMDHIKLVLGDIRRVHPGYDPEQGYEIAGFVWFQGWNDMVDGGTYPNRDKPRGYEQYSWLLAHFIRDVRYDLGVPDLPFVIGVMGVGGESDGPNYFRQAMAAPADYEEFKGNVAAVHTEKYWDKQLEELANRNGKVGRKTRELQVKDGLEGDELKKAVAEYRATLFTPEEEDILSKGRSNQGFHYLGSSKIMARIGKGFADAMIELVDKKQ
jgi:hypothetical protein